MNYFEHLARTAARSRRMIPGTELKFKEGVWTGENDNVCGGATLIALMTQLLDGWRKWPRGELPQYEVGLSAEGYVPLARDQLGDSDKELWSLGLNGTPDDPWKRIYILPLCDLTGKLFNFATITVGGREAIDDLINETVRLGPEQEDGMMPVIKLGVGGYQHPRFGPKKVPTLEVVDWAIPPAPAQARQLPPTSSQPATPQIEKPKPATERPKQAKRDEIDARLVARSKRGGDLDDEVPF